jgi:hypothetical protein
LEGEEITLNRIPELKDAAARIGEQFELGFRIIQLRDRVMLLNPDGTVFRMVEPGDSYGIPRVVTSRDERWLAAYRWTSDSPMTYRRSMELVFQDFAGNEYCTIDHPGWFCAVSDDGARFAVPVYHRRNHNFELSTWGLGIFDRAGNELYFLEKRRASYGAFFPGSHRLAVVEGDTYDMYKLDELYVVGEDGSIEWSYPVEHAGDVRISCHGRIAVSNTETHTQSWEVLVFDPDGNTVLRKDLGLYGVPWSGYEVLEPEGMLVACEGVRYTRDDGQRRRGSTIRCTDIMSGEEIWQHSLNELLGRSLNSQGLDVHDASRRIAVTVSMGEEWAAILVFDSGGDLLFLRQITRPEGKSSLVGRGAVFSRDGSHLYFTGIGIQAIYALGKLRE